MLRVTFPLSRGNQIEKHQFVRKVIRTTYIRFKIVTTISILENSSMFVLFSKEKY